MKYAIAIRRENMAIRLLELAIGQAKTAEEVAKAIKDAFVTQFRAKEKNDVVPKT